MLIGLVCLHASLRLPAEFGRFDAYATTYPSIEAFNKAGPKRHHLWLGYGSSAPIEISEDEIVTDAIVRLGRGERLPPEYPVAIRRFAEVSVLPRLAGGEPRARLLITLTEEQRRFDWAAGRFLDLGPDQIVGTLDLESLTLTP